MKDKFHIACVIVSYQLQQEYKKESISVLVILKKQILQLIENIRHVTQSLWGQYDVEFWAWLY